MKNSIAVVGLGNLLLADEGFGVHLVRHLSSCYTFSGVDIIDGGTIGFRLIEYFLTYTRLIFVDAIRVDDTPGSIYRFSLSEVPPNVTFVSSIHEIGLGDVLEHVKLMGLTCDATVVGVVPAAVSPNRMSTSLSSVLSRAVGKVASVVLEEIVSAGGSYARRGNCPEHT